MNLTFKQLFKKKKANTARTKFLKLLPIYGTLIVGAIGLYLFKLGSLVPFNYQETPQALGAASGNQIRHDILYAPNKVLEYLILKIGDTDSWIRVASIACVLTAAALLYMLLRKWHSKRISLLTIVLYLCSSFVLHVGRFASHEVLYLTVVPVLLLSCLWLLSKDNNKKLPAATVLLTLSLYIPGTIVLLLCGFIAYRKYILKSLTKINTRVRLICSGIFVIGSAPLVYSFITNKSQILLWLGFDRNQDMSLRGIGGNFVDIGNQLVWHGLTDPLHWVIGTPILDILGVAMVGLGIYAYRVGLYPAREKLVFSLSIVSILLIWLGHVASIALLIPLLYILIANGLAYMLQSWFTVFPKNPFARSVGVVLLTIVVALSCAYNLQRYFVVWPNTPATKQALVERR